jgi:threonine synthase
VLEALRRTGGVAEVVSDDETIECAKALATREGLYVEISAAPSVAGVMKLMKMGIIEKGDTIVCELTGTGLKSSREYSQIVQAPFEIQPDLDSLVRVLKT